jgi:predicted transcriptional regulator
MTNAQSSIRPHHAAAEDSCANYIPPQVEQLSWRERQVALVIYRYGYATARDVESALGGEISNGAVRSMLVRLVRKGILARRRGGPGAGCRDLFIAALSLDHARERALSRVADEFFSGSLPQLHQYVKNAAEWRDSRNSPVNA